MASESATFEEALKARLTSDATLNALVVGVWEDFIPQGKANNPGEIGVVYTHTPGADTNALAGNRVFAEASWSVNAVGARVSRAAMRPVVDQIDTLLHNWQEQGGNGEPGWVCVRDGETRNTINENGVVYTMLGATYAVTMQPDN